MKTPKTSSVFLERASYRQRRLRDAVRLLPVAGIVLWCIPLLWSTEPDQKPSSAQAMVYMFGVWVLLIIVMAGLSRFLKSDDATAQDMPD